MKSMEEQAIAVIKKHGGKKSSNMMYPWKVKTRLGNLLISPVGELSAIFMRFDEPNKYYGNPFSGKWNIHFPNVEYGIEELDWRLQKIK